MKKRMCAGCGEIPATHPKRSEKKNWVRRFCMGCWLILNPDWDGVS